MEPTLRRVAVAPIQFLNMPSILRVYGSQGPSSRRYAHRGMEWAFVQDPKKPVSDQHGEALSDMRKRMSRVVSHGQNIYANLLKSFAFTPVTGYWVLKDTGMGVWMVTNPKKGHIKFVHDDFDRHGRLNVTQPHSIDQVVQGVEDYTGYLKAANQFVGEFCEKFNIERTCPATTAKTAAVSSNTRAEEVRPRPGPEGARRDAVHLNGAPNPDLARRRFREWQRQKPQELSKTPFLTDREKESMIQTARKLLKRPGSSPQAVSGTMDALDIKIFEKYA